MGERGLWGDNAPLAIRVVNKVGRHSDNDRLGLLLSIL